MRSGNPRRTWPRRLAGFGWLVAWLAILYVVAAPWRHLGGLVDDRLRWLEAVVLIAGLAIGFTVGRWGRDLVESIAGSTHHRLLRGVLYPPALLTAGGLLVLTILGMRGAVGVAVSGFLSYWAGLDLAFGALPLLEGKDYRFARPLEPPPPPATRRVDPGWLPPWERF